MKRLIFVILSLVYLISSIDTNGQILITKNDSIPIGQDTVVNIVLPDARGSIQWQKSLDSKGWINLDAETNDTLIVKTDVEALYRAIVIDGTCLPVISDSVGVVTSDSISQNFVNPTSLGLELVSDSTDISNGNYLYTGTDETNGLEIGKVIIDESSGGTIRKITDIERIGDTVTVKTEQATMEDLFFNTSFRLSTEMYYPTQNLKSASLVEIGKALTDKDGFIHPAEIYSTTEDGAIIKSASIYSENKNTQQGSLFIYKDFSDTQLFDLHGPITYKNESGQSISVTGDVKSYIQQGHFKFDPVFKFELAYKKPEINWVDLRISKGELDKFAFYADKAQLEFKNIIVTEWNVACILGKSWVLYPNILPPRTFMFYPGGIPVMITFSVDLDCKISTKLGTGSTATIGYYNTNTVTFGARYENKDWQTIEQLNQGTEVITPESLYGNIELKFEVYPSVKIKIYDVAGPFANIGPNISYNLTTSVNQQNWDKSLDLGIDLKLGVATEIFGKKVLSYTPVKREIYSKNLFNSPNNLSLKSEDNQLGQAGNELSKPVIVKVTNSLKQPVKNVQVYFSPISGSVSESKVKTDSEGIAQTKWTLSSNAGSQRLGIQILDGKDRTIEGGSLIVNATATSSSLPTVTTTTITAITQTTATGGGNVTADGGAAVTARGVCWSTIAKPTTANSKTTNGTGTGSFTSSLTGLTANTPYYVRAYATNSAGTAYGSQVTFTTGQLITQPTVTTTTITAITQTTATGGGNVTADGGAAVTARGICWSTAPNPTTANSKTTNGTGKGSFTSSLTGLTANTPYYVRAYATNSQGTAYGNEVTFTTGQTITQPTVTTTTITDITQTTASGGGNVTADGGAPVTARGICWNTAPNPTTANSKTTNGTGKGSFTSSLTGLTVNTPYYVRAYATNSQGTVYGYEVTFTTSSDGNLTGTFTDPRDGHVYKTIKIGEQVWMAENLAYLPAVSPATEESYTDPYYYVYGYQGTSVAAAKATENYATYGVLYNWLAAMASCPTGWHLPTDAEWTALENYLIANGYNYDGTTTENKIAKSMAATTNWSAESGTGTIGNNLSLNNKSGFSALPGGYRGGNGYFNDVGDYGGWWGSTKGGTSGAWYRGLYSGSSDVRRFYEYNEYGFSVRCIKEDILSMATVTTSTPTNISLARADLGGSVINDGGSTVTERGIVYSNSTNPTTGNNKVIIGNGTGTFNSTISGLTMDTQYYVRAYATNSQGTTYGNEVTFKTRKIGFGEN